MLLLLIVASNNNNNIVREKLVISVNLVEQQQLRQINLLMDVLNLGIERDKKELHYYANWLVGKACT
jgi:hypothetical protein